MLAPGALCLGLFTWLLTHSPTDVAGRAYAAYGGIYIGASLLWLWVVDGTQPDRRDAGGAVLCLAGAFAILFGART